MVTLLQSMEDFSAERLLGGVDLTIEAPEFSFSAWVKTTPQFVRGRSQESVFTHSLSTSPSPTLVLFLSLSLPLHVSLTHSLTLTTSARPVSGVRPSATVVCEHHKQILISDTEILTIAPPLAHAQAMSSASGLSLLVRTKEREGAGCSLYLCVCSCAGRDVSWEHVCICACVHVCR